MYNTYTTSTVSFRAKSSLLSGDFYHPFERSGSLTDPPYPISPFPSYTVSINPRFLYGFLRQSTLIRWSPSRTLFTTSGCGGARYRKLRYTAPEGRLDVGFCDVVGLLSEIESKRVRLRRDEEDLRCRCRCRCGDRRVRGGGRGGGFEVVSESDDGFCERSDFGGSRGSGSDGEWVWRKKGGCFEDGRRRSSRRDERSRGPRIREGTDFEDDKGHRKLVGREVVDSEKIIGVSEIHEGDCERRRKKGMEEARMNQCIGVHDWEETKSTQKVFRARTNDREENLSAVDRARQVVDRRSQNTTDVSEIRSSSAELARDSDRGESSSSVIERNRREQQVTGEFERQYMRRTDASKYRTNDTQRDSSSQRFLETRVTDQEENLSFVERARKDQRVAASADVNRRSQNFADVSELHESITEWAGSSQKFSGTGIVSKGEASTSLNRIDYERSQKLTSASDSRRSAIERTSSSQKNQTLVARTDIDRRLQSVNDTSEIHEIDREWARRNKEASTSLNRMDFEGRSQRLTNASDSHTSDREENLSLVDRARKVVDRRSQNTTDVLEIHSSSAELARDSNREESSSVIERNRREQQVTGELERQSMRRTDASKYRTNDTQRDSSSQRFSETQVTDQEENLSFVERARKDQRLTTSTDVDRRSQNVADVTELHESNTEWAGSSQKFSGTGVVSRGEASTSLNRRDYEQSQRLSASDSHRSATERTSSSQKNETLVARTDIDRRSQSVNDSSEIHEIDTEWARSNEEASTSLNQMVFEGRSQRLTNASDSHTSTTERVGSSHKLSDTSVNESEENLTLVEHARVGQIRRGDFSSQDERFTNIAQGHVSETNKVSNSEKLFETRINVQEQNLTRIEQQIVDRRSQSITNDSDVRETSRSRHNLCETSVDDQEDNSASMAYLFHESREEQDQEAELSGQLRIRSRKDSRKTNERLSNSQTELNSRIYDQEKTALSMPSVQEARENQKSTLSGEAGSSQVMSSQEGSRLESVGHLDKSSSQFFGDFVEKVRQEMSTSHETEIESEHSAKTIDVVQQNILDASVKGRSSTESKKGPSDEMWDVMAGSPQEVAVTEAPIKDSTTEGVVVESTPLVNTETAIVKRSGRSLWSYITEIVRKSLGAHSDSHNSAQKSGTRSSSNESISSEAWYSGQEPDDDENDNAKKERLGTAKEASQNRKHVDQTHDKTRPSKSKSPVKDQEVNQGKSFQEGTSQVGASVSISLGSTPQEGSLNIELVEGVNMRSKIPSHAAVFDSSPALMGPVINVEGTSGSKEASVPVEATGVEGKEAELKRRKLQRNKQVPKEQFDDWEEAYKLESEQKRIDEMFMREALMEAKKAADSWEVPVGAVLVHDGKIIARACNLVEEARDSTAHAEMICIREASSALRTWRLSETTLYVTLEPCPMCAGAILQSRIDHVVWGAPNKLLGADGSWVRLFPGGDEGNNSLDQLDRTIGPVHPFHPKITVRRGVLSAECSEVMQQFFQLRRRKKDKKPEPSPQPPPCLPISNRPTKFFTKMHDVFCMMFCL